MHEGIRHLKKTLKLITSGGIRCCKCMVTWVKAKCVIYLNGTNILQHHDMTPFAQGAELER